MTAQDPYRRAFAVALAGFIVAAGVAAALAWRLYVHAAPAGRSHPPPAAATGTAAPQAVQPQHSTLEPVQLSPQRLAGIGVQTGAVVDRSVSQDIRSVGNVVVDERRLSTVHTRFAGWIRKVYADATYDTVKRGQPLFTIYSPDLVTTEREYLVAKQNRDTVASSAVPGVAAGAQSILDASLARLRQWELPQREIDRLESTGQARDEIEVDSPAAGYITERNVLPNMYVQPQTDLYTIADLSSVWVIGDFFQDDIGRFKPGQTATITTDAYPGRVFRGRVDRIYPQIDTTTRTGKVRFALPNPQLKLLPGMFVNVAATIAMGRALVVSASAVLRSGLRDIVFVDHGAGYLEPRPVDLGPRVGDEVVALKGLRVGERVVTSANFLVDSESQLQAAIGSFAPAPAAGSAAVRPAPTAATLTLTTDPSPPKKGANTIRVSLKDGSGAPLGGATVRVTFFMPAMPAMGMAAMRENADLAESAAGTYSGRVTLGSGGTWQVTVVAEKGGRTIARQQASVTAMGGM